jgi:hypothetical protein
LLIWIGEEESLPDNPLFPMEYLFLQGSLRRMIPAGKRKSKTKAPATLQGQARIQEFNYGSTGKETYCLS